MHELSCPITEEVLLWGKIESRTRTRLHGGCLSIDDDNNIIIEHCNADFKQQFMLLSDSTIRPFGTNYCLTSDKYYTTIFIHPCGNKTATWSIIEPMQQLMHIASRRCLTKEGATITLNRCNNSTNQTWKFGHKNEQTRNKPLTFADVVMLQTQTKLPNADIPEITPPIKLDRTKRQIESTNDSEIEAPLSSMTTEQVWTKIKVLHEQFKENVQIEPENKLATEIRQIYCQLTKMRRYQITTLSQINGVLAAAALDMQPCSKIQGYGETLMLQECKLQETEVTAVETICGFQPFFSIDGKNYTIGIDGWTQQRFTKCFWQSQLVNLNGRMYMWIHNNNTDGKWVEQIATLHIHNMELIAKFKEVTLKDYDYSLAAHPAHDFANLDQLNLITDLMARIQEVDVSQASLEKVLVPAQQESQLQHAYSWLDTLKIMVLCVIGFIFTLICIRMCTLINPFGKIIHTVQTYQYQ